MSDYNGWKNYPTWNVKLWLDNDESTVEWVKSMYAEAADNIGKGAQLRPMVFSLKEWTLFEFRDRLEDAIKRQAEMEIETPSMFTDCLQWAIGQADFFQIAKAYQEEFTGYDA